jgi:hypothetical protein
VTGQKQTLTELKSSWPAILTGDLLAVILSPGDLYNATINIWGEISCHGHFNDTEQIRYFSISMFLKKGISSDRYLKIAVIIDIVSLGTQDVTIEWLLKHYVIISRNC